MIPADTDPKARRVQIEVWRAMGVEGRSRAAAQLSQALLATARHQIVLAHPDWDARTVTLALIERLHGSIIASRIRASRGGATG